MLIWWCACAGWQAQSFCSSLPCRVGRDSIPNLFFFKGATAGRTGFLFVVVFFFCFIAIVIPSECSENIAHLTSLANDSRILSWLWLNLEFPESTVLILNVTCFKRLILEVYIYSTCISNSYDIMKVLYAVLNLFIYFAKFGFNVYFSL